MKDVLSFFSLAKNNLQKPFLLEFNDYKSLIACGINPVCTLEVKGGVLFKDGIAHGPALKIFDYLTIPKGSHFFPAWLGFFAYDFHNYLGDEHFLNSKISSSTIPDAFFQFFNEGFFAENHICASQSLKQNTAAIKEISCKVEQKEFLSQIKQVKKIIKNGDVYQVNLSAPFHFSTSDSEFFNLYKTIRKTHKNPFSALVMHDEWGILSASPEKLFSVDNHGIIKTKPIAGTKRRGQTIEQEEKIIAELKNCPKENAEHVMLVDLLRNDLNKICEKSSVQVTKDRSVEFFSHVMHLVSEVEGKTNKPLLEIFKAIFPGGTITGAPKINAIKTIDTIETTKRGPYTGSLGYISAGFGTCFNILIRSIYKSKNQAWINTGAGIVIDSKPLKEWQEIHKKAQGVTDILQQKTKSSFSRKNIIGESVLLQQKEQLAGHIAFFENKDSFSFNIISALESLGAKVCILESADDLNKKFSHVVLGPGPGNPQDMPLLMDVIQKTLQLKLPLLGICLGHQAIGHFFGANVVKAKPIHGQSQNIYHHNQGLFAGINNPATFTRYHSLVVHQVPQDFIIDAKTKDDLIMAIRHKEKPIFGVQFHPESYLSLNGEKLFSNFLRVSCVDNKR